MNTRRVTPVLAWSLVMLCCPMLPLAAHAQGSGGTADATDLAKKTQNPIADLVSLPFQFNFNSGGDLEDGTLFNLNFQPVVPVKVSQDWNLIARAIVPYLDIPTATGSEAGTGDIIAQMFFTPTREGRVIWGVGPVFSFPTATNAFARTGSWATGVGAVVVHNVGPWVLGGLVTNFWTVSDSGDSTEMNQLQAQPFINYNFGKGWALASAPLITANWDAESGEQWTVPIGIGISRTTVFGKQPLTLGLQYYNSVERPTGSPVNQLRFAISLLFPQ